MDFNNWLAAALGIVSIATLAGLGFMRGTVINLREQLSDARGETKALKESRDEASRQIATLKTDLAALTRVVTGEAHWVSIGHKLDEHHDAAMSHWDTGEQTLGQILDELRRKP